MNLRVFGGQNAIIYAELSSRQLPFSTRVLIPMIKPDDAAVMAGTRLSQDSAARIMFQGNPYLAYVLLVTSLDANMEKLVQLGELDQTDSINVLNHFLDLSAYTD